jgi:hypothetical protein
MNTPKMSFLLAPVLMASSIVIPPPPRVILEGQFRAYSPAQLFDQLTYLHREKQYCIPEIMYNQTKHLEEWKKTFINDPTAFTDLINCTISTLDSADAITILETAIPIGKEKFGISDLPNDVVSTQYNNILYFYGWGNEKYRDSNKRLLPTVRAIAQKYNIPTADLEHKVVTRGFDSLSIFVYSREYEDERKVREDLHQIAKKNHIDVRPLEKKASEHLYDGIKKDLEWDDTELIIRSSIYSDGKSSLQSHKAAWKFARVMGRNDEKSVKIAGAAAMRIMRLSPHTKYPQIRTEIQRMMELASLATHEFADEKLRRQFVELQKSVQSTK